MTATAASEVRSRPILFTAPMVRAILAGTKTQTRRIVKPQPPVAVTRADIIPWPNARGSAALWCGDGPIDPLNGMDYKQRHPPGWNCPYGFPEFRGNETNPVKHQPGTRLWVRESVWRAEVAGQGIGNGFLIYEEEMHQSGPTPETLRPWDGRRWGHIPSIHMPRWASRLTLEITDVRVQRLQEISRGDCAEEGWPVDEMKRATAIAYRDAGMDDSSDDGAIEWYANLWEQINGAGSWDANPWVWAISFKRIEFGAAA